MRCLAAILVLREMRFLKFSRVLLATPLLAGCADADRSRGPAAQKPVPLKAFVLHDVQTRFGGDALWAKKGGPIIIQVVEPEGLGKPEKLREKRYQLKARPGLYSEVELIVGSRNLLDLKLKGSAGSADTRTSIMLVPEVGLTVKLTRWGKASERRFDQLHEYLRNRCREIEVQEKPVYEGPYDKDWRPEGFERPW
jgi:hypothetical protein